MCVCVCNSLLCVTAGGVEGLEVAAHLVARRDTGRERRLDPGEIASAGSLEELLLRCRRHSRFCFF